MAYITYIEKFKKGDDEYNIKAASAETAIVADRAITADTVDSIGNVRKYSGFYDGKQREGLQIINNSGEGSEALIELNDKGNFALESKTKHLNLESAKGIQIKPTATLTLDSTRRIIAGKGNEIQVEARFDDFGEVTGYKGADEEWAELKINSRNLDLRCRDHGGIALQIAGKDSDGNENKIKFESDRTNSIYETGTYNGEGGKGLEFGTFNNLHSSLYTGDYRFRGKGMVYGVLREAPVQTETGKWDYPTQSDDFKDPTGSTTPRATWNQIIDAANKCNGKEEIASIQDVAGMIAEASIPGYTGTTEHLATQEYVQNYVNEHGGGSSYEAGNGIHIEDNTISVNNYSSIEPLTSLTKNLTALSTVKIGKEKGNLKIDVKGKYTYEAKVDAIDEFGNEVLKGGRVVNYIDEDFYNDPTKYYYKSLVDGTYENTNQYAKAGSFAYKKSVMTSIEPGTYFYTAKKNARLYSAEGQGEVVEKGRVIIQTSSMTAEEMEYYDCKLADNKWTKGYVIDDGDNEEFYENWEKVSLWIKNEINVNLETDSKIKFDGAKIETTTEDLVVDATQVSFESKVTENGDFVDDTNIVYVFDNKLLDENGDAVIDVDNFRSNYRGKHPQSELTDEEVNSLYSEYIAKGKTETISVRISDLLKLVNKVAELETRIAALENQ